MLDGPRNQRRTYYQARVLWINPIKDYGMNRRKMTMWWTRRGGQRNKAWASQAKPSQAAKHQTRVVLQDTVGRDDMHKNNGGPKAPPPISRIETCWGSRPTVVGTLSRRSNRTRSDEWRELYWYLFDWWVATTFLGGDRIEREHCNQRHSSRRTVCTVVDRRPCNCSALAKRTENGVSCIKYQGYRTVAVSSSSFEPALVSVVKMSNKLSVFDSDPHFGFGKAVID
jgi:hypothetical protein